MSCKTAFDNRTNAYVFDPEDLVLIDDETHDLYDSRVKLPVDEGLVLSMMSQGFFGAIEIAKRDGKAQVVDGRRRVKAAREANRRLRERGLEPIRVPAMLARGMDVDLWGITISANLHRTDDSPLENARKVARYMAFGRDEKDAAAKFGVTEQAIKQWLKLLEVAAPVQKAVEKGRISATAASKLAGLDREEQVEKLRELEEATPVGKKVSAKAVKQAANGGPVRPGVKQIRERLRGTESELGQPLSDEGRLRRQGAVTALRWVLGEE